MIIIIDKCTCHLRTWAVLAGPGGWVAHIHRPQNIVFAYSLARPDLRYGPRLLRLNEAPSWAFSPPGFSRGYTIYPL